MFYKPNTFKERKIPKEEQKNNPFWDQIELKNLEHQTNRSKCCSRIRLKLLGCFRRSLHNRKKYGKQKTDSKIKPLQTFQSKSMHNSSKRRVYYYERPNDGRQVKRSLEHAFKDAVPSGRVTVILVLIDDHRRINEDVKILHDAGDTEVKALHWRWCTIRMGKLAICFQRMR